MKTKKKNGFTLIELLIAVAIMLTIMGIAIVSFVNISDRKKKEAWGNVKGQIETAADSYIESNLYNYEFLDENDTATVSVGTLVRDDYLNKVVDPRNGKSVSQCMLVKITKKDGIIETEVDDGSKDSENNDCDSTFITSYTPNGGPKITDISKKCGDSSWPSKDGWCNISISKKKNISNFEAEAKENGNGKIVKYEYSISDSASPTQEQIKNLSYSNGKSASSKDSTNKTGKSICFKVTNVNNVSSYFCKDFKADFIVPTGNVTISTNTSGYNSNKVILNGEVTDNNSGINTISFNPSTFSKTFTKGDERVSLDKLTGNITSSLDGSTKNLKVSVTDVAGNQGEISSNNYLVYKECGDNTDTETKYGTYGSCTGTCGTGSQTRTNIISLKDKSTGKVCNSKNETEANTCALAACPKLECPAIKIVGAVKGDNGWYKKGTMCVADDGKSHNSCVTITPTSSTHHWAWATGYEGKSLTTWTPNNTGSLTKAIGEGKRTFQVTVYDALGNSKDFSYTANIDTTLPSVSCRSISIRHKCDGKDRNGTYRSGSAIFTVKVNNTMTHYNCPGYLYYVSSDCDYSATSGIKNVVQDPYQTYNTKSGGCLITSGENPCSAYWNITVTSNAGNSSSYKINFKDDYYKNGAADNNWYNRYYK